MEVERGIPLRHRWVEHVQLHIIEGQPRKLQSDRIEKAFQGSVMQEIKERVILASEKWPVSRDSEDGLELVTPMHKEFDHTSQRGTTRGRVSQMEVT